MIERGDIISFKYYIQDLIKSKYNDDISSVTLGDRARFFSLTGVNLPDPLKVFFNKAVTKLHENIKERFPGFPTESALDETNIDRMIHMFKEHCITDTQDLRDALEIVFKQLTSRNDEQFNVHFTRDLCTACITKIIQQHKMKFYETIIKDNNIPPDHPQKVQLRMLDQLAMLMIAATLDKNFEQFFSSQNAKEIRTTILDKMTPENQQKLVNADLLVINKQVSENDLKPTTPPQRPQAPSPLTSLFKSKSDTADDKRNRPEKKKTKDTTVIMPDNAVDDSNKNRLQRNKPG
jgi:hypothetical protein